MVKLMLIDGNSLANRAYYAIPSLTNSDGFATNAIFGFVNMLNRVWKEEKPDYLAVAFDAGKIVFRHAMYAAYKGSRKSTPEELKAQFPVLRETLTVMGVPWLELEGYEADDLIGTLALQGSKAGMTVRIITGDRDCFQLIDENTVVLYTRKGISELEEFDEKHLREVYGLAPWQIVEMKGLMGDNSDDIPGIPGIGEKTALKLLADHDSVEGVLAAAGMYTGRKLGEKLIEFGDLARLSRQLAEICKEAPISVALDTLVPGAGDPDGKVRLFQRLEFRGLLAEAIKESNNTHSSGDDDMAAKPGVKANIDRDAEVGMAGLGRISSAGIEDDSSSEAWTVKENAPTGQMDLFKTLAQKGMGVQNSYSGQPVESVDDVVRLRAYLSPLEEGGRLYVLPVTSGHSWRSFSWVGIGLMSEGNAPIWVPLDKQAKAAPDETSLKDGHYAQRKDKEETPLPIDDSLSGVLGPWLADAAITKILIDAKQADLYLRATGLRIAGPYEDLHLMSYLLDPANPWKTLEGLSELEPDVLAKLVKDETKAGRDYWNVAKVGTYLAAMAYLSVNLKTRLKGQKLLSLYKEAEEPLALILGDMERQGIRVVPEMLRAQGEMLKESIRIVEAEIYQAAGQEFSINSPKQLGEILFDKLRLPKGKKTKTGYSTDAATLEFLASEHMIARKVLEYRQYAKLRSTYVEGLLAIMDRVSGKIHSSLNQTITVTGRLSSTEPNLQNIPVRLEEGRRIRRAFIPSPGCLFLSGDYSQIELRLLAHLCGDGALRQAFLDGQDIHRSTASEVFGVHLSDVTPQQRRAAKAVNFGLIYGISDFGLAQDLGISRGEAKEYMERYFHRYPGVRVYFDHLLMEAAERGYVETVFGRRRYLPELKSGSYHTRSFGQRAAMNAPLQGTAADIMKFAMIAVKKLLEREGLGDAMILQVHDELLFDMPEEKVSMLKGDVKEAMENVVVLSVPLQVDMKIGSDWYSMEEV